MLQISKNIFIYMINHMKVKILAWKLGGILFFAFKQLTAFTYIELTTGNKTSQFTETCRFQYCKRWKSTVKLMDFFHLWWKYV